MPDLDFRITDAKPAVRGLVPLLHFQIEVRNTPADETIHSVLLQAQIQIQSPDRSYNAPEKEKLVEIFGTPERWGQTLRNKLWGHASVTVPSFTEKREAILEMPCSFDLNIAASKYFYALEGGEVPLLFLFSGTVFYLAPDGRVQVQRISWEKECTYRIPAAHWKELMDYHYPNTAWLTLDRGLFDRLYAYKRANGLASWEDALARLLTAAEQKEMIPS